MINLTYNRYITEMRQLLSEHLVDWENASAEMLLTAISQSNNQSVKETAEMIKISNKSQEMTMLIDFALSMIRNNPFPIREKIYDTAIDGVHELNKIRIEIQCRSKEHKNHADLNNWFWLFLYKIPAKADLKRCGLIF